MPSSIPFSIPSLNRIQRLARLFFVLLLSVAMSVRPGLAVEKSVDGPKRITSINQCTDTYAIHLADPEQIQSVTFLSADPEESLVAPQAQNYMLNVGSTEDVILSYPDFVLAESWTDPFVIDQLKKLNIKVGQAAYINSLEVLDKTYLEVGEWLGHRDRAEQQLAEIQATISSVTVDSSVQPLRYIVYSAGCYLAGNSTLQSEIYA